jgi:hypothetical protein
VVALGWEKKKMKLYLCYCDLVGTKPGICLVVEVLPLGWVLIGSAQSCIAIFSSKSQIISELT